MSARRRASHPRRRAPRRTLSAWRPSIDRSADRTPPPGAPRQASVDAGARENGTLFRPLPNYGQVSESIFTDVTRNDGTAADDDCVELEVVAVVDGLEVCELLDVVVLLESIVPVICTLWLR